jgi:hypothetical protein
MLDEPTVFAEVEGASMYRTNYLAVGFAVACLCVGCDSEPGPQGIPGNAPMQQPLAGLLMVEHHPFPDSAFLIVTVPVPDSTAHVKWTPAVVTITTSAGYQNDFEVVPFACLKPKAAGSFPFDFEWLTCNQVAVSTSALLSAGEISELEADVDGRVFWSRARTAEPGADYLLFVPVGEQATAEAARRARLHARVTSAGVPSNDPRCVRSDEIPAPPCPTWVLHVQVPYASGAGSKDTVPVVAGGWVRARYVDDHGVPHTAEYQVPPS